MSFFSQSSGRRPYRNPYNGGNHYQKKGLFGKLGSLMGSFSSGGRGGYYPPQGHPTQQPLYRADAPQPQDNAFCTSCGSKVPAGSKFCLECGAKMNTESVCSGCGNSIPPNAKFCPSCGAPRR